MGSPDARSRRQLTPEQLRENLRQQVLTNIGGWSGALIAAIPTAVFVIVYLVTALRPAIYAAVGAAVLLTLYRLVRRQPVQQAVSGLFGVVVAAVIAARTGQARGYFLFGILTSFAYSVPFLVSLPLRRPLVGLFWEFLDPTPMGGDRPWHRRRRLLVAYTWVTVIAAGVFLLRGIVQLTLYLHNADGWLGVARIVMGYPLFIAAVGAAFWIVRRARKAETAAEPPTISAAPDAEGTDPGAESADPARPGGGSSAVEGEDRGA